MRADYWLRKNYPGLSRRHIGEALARGLVRSADGSILVKGAAVSAGRTPDCELLDRYLERLRAGNTTLQIPVLHESESLAVLDKPPGVPSHPVSLFDTDTVTNWAIARYPEILAWAPECQPTITPHRLDTDTSGILLVARTGLAYATWRRRFAAKQVEKRYLAWCWGRGPDGSRIIDATIAHDPRDRRKMVTVDAWNTVASPARTFSAITEVRTVRQLTDRCLCELVMCTGVTHQIRVHMASIGNPLLGDWLYDPEIDRRIEKTPHTLLRSTAIRSGGFEARADGANFSKLY